MRGAVPPKHMSTISLRLMRPRAFSLRTRYRENSSIRKPWPTSPNITANRNGKVTTVKICTQHRQHHQPLHCLTDSLQAHF